MRFEQNLATNISLSEAASNLELQSIEAPSDAVAVLARQAIFNFDSHVEASGAHSLADSMTTNTADGPGNIRTADAAQKQIKKAPATRENIEVEEVPVTNKKGEDIKAELDDILDEIDEVLEENAEEFVRSYVQKGGQ